MAHFNKHLFVLLLASVALIGCKDSSNKENNADKPSEQSVNATEELDATTSSDNSAATTKDIYGNYVSEGYAQKNEGYDWVSVAVTNAGNDQLNISVRSRADKKKPTCTFDAIAYKVNETTYSSTIDGASIIYSFENNNLSIAPEKADSEGVLAFYCSGGATLADTYKKINEPIDSAQVDPTLYSKVLMLQDIGFNISSEKKEGKNILTVTPFGLEISNDPVTSEIAGKVVNAEIEDLNSDGSPEVLIYTQTEDSNKYGDVYGFSVNNKKSMSQVYFPPIKENAELSKGYKGQDEFVIVETSLAQRFPIFEGAKQTDKTRQITYKLVDGEASRSFAVDQVNEF